MNKALKQVTMICASALYFASPALATDIKDNKFYFAVEGGYSQPPKTKFKDEGVVGKLSGSGVIEAKVGYMFYPDIALELAYAYRPKYDLKLSFPEAKVRANYGMTGAISKVKVASHAVMLSLVYFAQTDNKFTPFFSAGIGYAHVTPKQANVNATTLPANPLGNGNFKIGNVKKHVSERMGIRVGGGVLTELSPNMHLSTGVKLEVISNIGLHTDWIHPVTKAVQSTASLKKTIGVVELTAGLRISL